VRPVCTLLSRRYRTAAGADADVYEIRGAYCLGYVKLPEGQKTAIWRTEHGGIMGGTPDHDLMEYIGPFERDTVQ